MNSEIVELVYADLKGQLNQVQTQVDRTKRVERAEMADSLPAYNLADAPLAADGGLGDGTSYVTLAWISNGRKSGEGVGAGTGVLAVFAAGSNQWLRLTDYTAVAV